MVAVYVDSVVSDCVCVVWCGVWCDMLLVLTVLTR